MSQAVASRVYDVYGRFYDGFEWFFKRRLARAIGAIPFMPGDRVLDIGVGTGLSLDHYPGFVHVTGIDLSAGMLQQAQRKVDSGRVRADAPPGDTELIQANALDLPFADNSFDVVFLSHVISTVPDPHKCLAEAIRVGRDDALLVLVNHFRSSMPVVNWVESAIDPLCRKLGWRCDLSLEELLAPAGVKNPEAVNKVGGWIFRIAYLQKCREGLRLVAMPAQPAREPRLA